MRPHGIRWLALLAACSLTACASAPGQPAEPPVRIFKSQGSLQCSGGGTPVAALAQQLQAAGVAVISSACGTDGRMRIAMCGAADGRIGIFEVAARDTAAAAALGFAPLSRLPSAQVVTCPAP
jgi:hypothetical protein